MSWTQPMCDECFEEIFPKNANPHRMKEEVRQYERCCWCGKIGIRNGLYVRINPAFAPYATTEKLEAE